ncbi:MAG: FecR domain-containing protein [Anaerolineales bacterium]|nr:MAG: FecR domain-containing protein [Anaerolineales bacterium]
MQNNPERLAWTVLLLAFTMFCVVAITIPLGVRWYLRNAMTVEATAVTSVRGTVLAETRKVSLPVPITDGSTTEVEEATYIATDSTSQAILTFFNDSTLTLYSETGMRIQRARTRRFGLGRRPDTIVVELERGRVRAATTSQSDLLFEIHSPHAVISLGEGSFSIEVNDEGTQITARLGQAKLASADELVRLGTGERSVINPGQAPSPPLPAERNLLVNGDLSDPLEGVWEVYKVEPPSGVVTATVEIVEFNSGQALEFRSEGEDNLHSEVGVIQQVNTSVQDFDSLRVQVEVTLDRQSLPGGGTLGSEFPIMIHLAYKDINGSDRDWYHGFYYTPPPENWLLFNAPDNSSERVARFLRYPYESVNLLNSLGETKPVYIKYLRVYASGWIYQARVADIALLAQE